MTSSSMTVGLMQLAGGGSLQENLAWAVEKSEAASRAGATVLCLPELFRSPYFCQQEEAAFFDWAEPIPGPSTEALSAVAHRHKTVIIVPIFERRTAGLYHNSVVVLNTEGAIAGLYRKMHIPDDPAYHEKFYFTPGDTGFQAIHTKAGTIGTLLCWDQWYPEAARLTTLQGAQIVFYPTAIGWHPAEKADEGPAQREAWQIMHRSHAIANGVFVAAVNRVGHESPGAGGDGLEFWGSSLLCDPFGVMLAEASVEKEDLIMMEIDLGRIEAVRRQWPFLRDRRIEAYAGLTQRFLD